MLVQRGEQSTMFPKVSIFKITILFVNDKQHIIEDIYPDSKVHGANMGPIWVLSAPDGPHVGPMNLAISVCRVIVLCFILFLQNILSVAFRVNSTAFGPAITPALVKQPWKIWVSELYESHADTYANKTKPSTTGFCKIYGMHCIWNIHLYFLRLEHVISLQMDTSCKNF